jgi:hypothetical protein
MSLSFTVSWQASCELAVDSGSLLLPGLVRGRQEAMLTCQGVPFSRTEHEIRRKTERTRFVTYNYKESHAKTIICNNLEFNKAIFQTKNLTSKLELLGWDINCGLEFRSTNLSGKQLKAIAHVPPS